MSYRRDKLEFIKSPFQHPWWLPYGDGAPKPRTKDEWAVIDVINLIIDKPDWITKFNQESIRNKWKQEIELQLVATSTLVDNLLKLIFHNLQWIADTQSKITPFKISVDDKIVYGDGLIDETDKKIFIDQVNQLKSSFQHLDYHPNTNNQVIDLVHPSLYPLQYGVTPVFNDNTGEIEIHQYDEKKVIVKLINDMFKSENFQWLPSLFTYDSSQNKFVINSYINNLHPIKFKPLYDSLQSIFNSVLPGLNYVLSRYASQEYIRITWDDWTYYNQEYQDKLQAIYDNNEDDAEIDRLYDELDETKLQYLIPPNIDFDGPITDHPIDLKTFENIKVITKLADIELTPENPTYNGGSWHVEGTISEDIVATIIYYYDVENISESSLSFRTGFDDPQYEQGDNIFAEQVFGIADEQKMSRDLGLIKTIKDRILIFPNIFQHHVDPFQLKDKSKNGHRRILAFFVVDPHNPYVVSTDKVPIQQQEWWNDGTNLLTQEVMDKMKLLNPNLPQSLDEAKDVRVKLMAERSAEVDEDDAYEHPFLRQFSLCEH